MRTWSRSCGGAASYWATSRRREGPGLTGSARLNAATGRGHSRLSACLGLAFQDRLRRPHLLKTRGLLEENHQPATANRMLSALRGVLKECWQGQLMTSEEYQAPLPALLEHAA